MAPHGEGRGRGRGGLVVHAAAAVSAVGSSGVELSCSPSECVGFPSGSSHSPKQED